VAFHGRTAELSAVESLVSGVLAGHGGALVVSGPAGIGKTALVDEAVQRRSGAMRVLRAAGTEFEVRLPFAGLHQLCQPLLDRLGDLAPPQADALRRAFGLSDGRPAADLLVGAGVRSLLAATGTRPLLCVVDDVQWLDVPSTDALAFAARRLGELPAGLLLLRRDGAPIESLRSLPELRLGGLPGQVARTLLQDGFRAPLDPRVRDRVIAEADGNPLALLELPRAFGPALLAGGFALPDAGGLPGALEAGFVHRLSRLPAPSKALVTLAAAEPTGDAPLLWRAAEKRGLPADAALAVEATGLLTIGLRVRFRHPLVRSAIYHAAPLAERQAAHRALAAATDPVLDPDRRAWHRASAAYGPDEEVAAELVSSAQRAQARGGIAATAAFLERAAALTPDGARRSARLLAAAEAKHAAGAGDHALDLLDLADAGQLSDAELAYGQALRARIGFDQRRDTDSVRGLLAAGRALAVSDPARGRAVLAEALADTLLVGRFAHRDLLPEIAAAAHALPPRPGGRPPSDLLLEGLLLQAAEEHTAAAGVLRQGVDAYLDAPSDRADLRDLRLAGNGALVLWDDEAFGTIAERQLTLVRSTGAVTALPVALSYRAQVAVRAGQFQLARALVEESYDVAAELGAPPVRYVDLALAAWEGDEARTGELAALATTAAEGRREGRLLTAVEYARAVLLNGLGRYAEAMEAAAPGAEFDEIGYPLWLPPEFVEAAVRAGEPGRAETVLRRIERTAAVVGNDWTAGIAARCAALLLADAAAESRYRRAIELLGRGTAAAELARARLLFGEWLRREGRKSEARVELRSAHEAFTGLGAHAFAGRAARELAATGERARSRRAGAPAPLTAQELQVARLVAGGATTKDAAAALFLSPRTVDAHLRSIFAKLGITSRRQLRGRAELSEP